MADAVAARREARRRRILENGDSRLRRITGQIAFESSPADASKCLEKAGTSLLNGDIRDTSVTDSRQVPSKFEDNLPSTSSEDFFSVDKTSLPRRRNQSSLPNGEIHGHDCNESFHHEQPNAYFEYPEVNKSLEPENPRNFSLISFLKSRWVYLVLAAVVNVMIVLETAHLFGSNIVVPFALILISRLIFCKSTQESQSSMVFTALLLCNIRPKTIHRLKLMSGFIFKILREFSFYLFNFVVIYYFTSYWQDFDKLIPNKAEVIVDRQTEL